MQKLVIAVTVVLVAGLLVVIGCVGRNDVSVNDSNGSDTREASKRAIEIKGLSEKGNPFKDKYKSHDNWVFNNIVEEPVRYIGNAPKGMVTLNSYVTEDGYLVPQTEFVRWTYEKARSGDQSRTNISEYSVYSQAIMSEKDWDEYQLAIAAEVARFYDPVPDWVAADPPEKGMLMPNGDVLFIDSLEDDKEGCCGGTGSLIYRYSRDGELIRTARTFWWMTYFDGTIMTLPEGSMRIRRDGYVIFTDTESEQVLSVWDWDGTRTELTSVPEMRDSTPFITFTGEKLKNMNLAASL